MRDSFAPVTVSIPANKLTVVSHIPVLSSSVDKRRQDHNMQHTANTSEDHQPDPFAELVQAICQSLQPTTASSLLTASTSPMARPTTYSGEAEDCSRFCTTVIIELRQPISSPWLSGRVLQWVNQFGMPMARLLALTQHSLRILRWSLAKQPTTNFIIFDKINLMSVITPSSFKPWRPLAVVIKPL